MNVRKNIIGFEETATGAETFYSYNPATQQNNSYQFHSATSKETNSAVEKAAAAFQVYRKKSGDEKSQFLNAIAEGLQNSGDELITICCDETGLPVPRIQGERMRTINQLKMFAALIKEGSWVDARIETADANRQPIPKPDIRSMHIPLGPVVIFGASNFPLAFSVAGGDTASALAAGCTVVVKAHAGHPATSAIVGKIIQAAAKQTNMPDGVFSLLFDDGFNTGVQLVNHPSIKAVGFTGSFKGGKALADLAAKRPEPIPVYAEMGSTNPVFVLPGAKQQSGEAIANNYSAAVTLGVGQFCTNPGILIHQASTDNFYTQLKTAFEKTTGGVMLTPPIMKGYLAGIDEHKSVQGVVELATSKNGTEQQPAAVAPVLFTTDSKVFTGAERLAEEIFGPTGIVVHATSKKEILDIARSLTGHLTASVHGTAEDFKDYHELLEILEQKAGRIIFNGFPTGVEVCSAMVHGGPYPATTDSKTTSVGTAAIYRFSRPVCYQNMPASLLPAELQNENSLGSMRMINGELSRSAVI